MYRTLYPNDTDENRAVFLKDWANSYCVKQTEINHNISAKTLAANFSRCYFHLKEQDLILALINAGFNSEILDKQVFFNISDQSPFVKEFKSAWN